MRVDTAVHTADAYENKIELFIVLAASMAGTFMQTLDFTIANVALPYMQGSCRRARPDHLGPDILHRCGRDHDGARRLDRRAFGKRGISSWCASTASPSHR